MRCKNKFAGVQISTIPVEGSTGSLQEPARCLGCYPRAQGSACLSVLSRLHAAALPIEHCVCDRFPETHYPQSAEGHFPWCIVEDAAELAG